MNPNPLQPTVAKNEYVEVRSSDGDILKIPQSGYPSVLLCESNRGAAHDVLWTIRSPAAKVILDFLIENDFEFSIERLRCVTGSVSFPLLQFRPLSFTRTIGYAAGSVNPAEVFSEFSDMDLLAIDATIVSRYQASPAPASRFNGTTIAQHGGRIFLGLPSGLVNSNSTWVSK